MPGAWEIPQPDVMVATLTRGFVPTRWALGVQALHLPAGSVGPVIFSGMPFDHARNTAVERMMEMGFRWLFFLDDDVIPPPDVIPRLKAHGQDIVSGIYWRRQPPLLPVMLRETPQGAMHIAEWQPGALIEADLVGAGCLLIHRRVLERMPKPWFEWTLDRDDRPAKERASEDFEWCRKAKRLGFKVSVDTSVQCLHVGYAQSFGGVMTPLQQ